MEPKTSQIHESSEPLARFFAAPIQARSYTNLLYLATAFPLGLAYFIFLVVGLSLGVGLSIVWVGIPILALVLGGSWGLAALERQMAIHLLGARVPPMTPATPAAEGFWKQVGAFLTNPVTWKGMGYLIVKFPLGVATFTVVVFLMALSGGLLTAPFFYQWNDWGIQMGAWQVDTLGEALLCSALGVIVALISFNLLNALAGVWRGLASVMLGSERFAA
jgi:hypothetical protein